KEKVPSTYVKLDNEDDIKFMELLIEKLEEDDDVMNVYHNWEN
ncbi:MAG: YebC/PmpR family DNA-binding transcriptional regulator, partial [Clostridia bacterium]|nr:YebC/PmpR family DNA-binding transcriptional regulator [Clostridia bacterium]